MKSIKFIFTLLFFCFLFCRAQNLRQNKILPGIFQTEKYFPLLKDKKIGLIGNQTSVFFQEKHLLDSLLNTGVQVKKIFVLEHGFRAEKEAGASIPNGLDEKTGLPIVSLYGKNKKLQKNDLEDIDVLIFDIQDVGIRFYTYISSLYYILEAAGQNKKKIILLDRPNPHINYVDGPILEEKYFSFVGLYPIPLVYGMSIGELALMILGEKWLDQKVDLLVVPCANYTRKDNYVLPIPPSPNLSTALAIALYPSLGILEGTVVSEGRGTQKPFTCFGFPEKLSQKKWGNCSFIPQKNTASLHPKFLNQNCQGLCLDLIQDEKLLYPQKINWSYLEMAFENFADKENFFLNSDFFEKLTGTAQIRKTLLSGGKIADLEPIWQEKIADFLKKRERYLLYP